MTKTFTTIGWRHFAFPGQSVMMPLGTTVFGMIVWNFEFFSLGFV
jgi:hypothetical protein